MFIPFCPHKDGKDWKKMLKHYDEDTAYILWNKNEGNPVHLDEEGNPNPIFEQFKKAYGEDEAYSLIEMTFEDKEIPNWEEPAKDVVPPKEAVKEDGKEHGNIGVSHDRMNALRSELGLPPVERGTALLPKEQADLGRKLLNEGENPNDLFNSTLEPEDRIAVSRAHEEDLVRIADNIADKKSKEYDNALNKLKEYQDNVVKPLGTKFYAIGNALKGERDLDTDSFTEVSQAVIKSSGKEKITDKQIDDVTKLTNKTSKLTTLIKGLEDKLRELTDKHIGERPERQFTAKRAAEIADNLLAKGRLFRPGSFMMATPGSIVWDGAVKTVAESIRLSGKASDAIDSGIKHIKGTDWYEGLTHEKQKQAERDFRDFTEKELTAKSYRTEVGNNKRIADLEKQLTDLKNDKLPESKQKTQREKSEQEQELLTNIKTEKDRIKDKLDFQSLRKSMGGHKGNKFTPEESKAIWDYAKKKYLNNGASFRDMISNVSNDLGLSFFQVSNAIVTPKTKPITNEIWKTRYELNRNRSATQRYIDNQSPIDAVKAFKTVFNTIREVKVFGHGGVFVGTHAGMTLMDLPRAKYTVKAFFNAYKFAYGSNAGYEMAMSDLTGRPLYTKFKRLGLQNDPDRINNDSEILKPMFGKYSKAGIKGFNAIKVLRQVLTESHYNSLTPEEQKNDDVVRSITELVNNATGGTNINFRGGPIGKTFAEMTFAGGMELARWEKLIGAPGKAINIGFKAGKTLFNGEKVRPEDKVWIKTWGKRVGWELGTYAGLLVINAAVQSYANNGKNPVNLTNWREPDWLKMKIGDHTLDFSSGMISTENFIKKIGLTIFGDVPLNSKGAPKYHDIGSELLKKTGHYLRGKLAPGYADVADLAFHHDYSGNTLPMYNDKPENSWNRKLTWKEYLLEKSPLPIGEGVDVFYDEAQRNGATEDQTNNIVEGIMGTIVSGTTGFRMYKNDDTAKSSSGDSEKDAVKKVFDNRGAPSVHLTEEQKKQRQETSAEDEAILKQKAKEYGLTYIPPKSQQKGSSNSLKGNNLNSGALKGNGWGNKKGL
jgi:hypothetical protein